MYTDLKAWQEAYKLGLSVYKITQNYPKEENFGITAQLRRAATSIAANLAEGNTRQSSKEFKHFISISRGSLAEVETWLMFSKDLEYISNDQYAELKSQAEIVGKLLFGLHKSF